MPDLAKTYQFSDKTQTPTINGQDFPWYVSVDPPPMVESIADGAMHILWIPVQVDAPMPTPPEGRPCGDPVTVYNGHGEPIRTFSGPVRDLQRDEEHP